MHQMNCCNNFRLCNWLEIKYMYIDLQKVSNKEMVEKWFLRQILAVAINLWDLYNVWIDVRLQRYCTINNTFTFSWRIQLKFSVTPNFESVAARRLKTFDNKKVRLRERKRHTARRVASAHFADLSPDKGVPHPVLDRGYSIQSWMGGGTPSSPGYPHPGPHLVLDGGTPSSLGWGTPSSPGQGVSPSSLDGGVPQGIPCPDLGWGYPHPADGGTPIQTWGGVSPHPDLGTPCLDLGWGTSCPDLGWGTPHLDMGQGTPPPIQT